MKPDRTRSLRPDIVELLGPLRRYARSLTRDAPRADDLVHETLVRALEAKGSLRPDTNLRTWMMTVLHNVFIDEQRRKRVEARHADVLVQITEEVSLPSQEGRVRLAQIRRAFDSLPEEQRAALHLVTLEGMAYADAAAVLGIPIGTLMSRLGRGRAALRAFEDGDPGATRRSGDRTKGAEGPSGPRHRERPMLRLVPHDEARDAVRRAIWCERNGLSAAETPASARGTDHAAIGVAGQGAITAQAGGRGVRDG